MVLTRWVILLILQWIGKWILLSRCKVYVNHQNAIVHALILTTNMYFFKLTSLPLHDFYNKRWFRRTPRKKMVPTTFKTTIGMIHHVPFWEAKTWDWLFRLWNFGMYYQQNPSCFTYLFLFTYFFFFFGFFLATPAEMLGEGLNWSCEPLAYIRATATPDLSGACDLHHSSRQYARSLTHSARPGIEPMSSWILVRFIYHWAMTGTP